MQNPISTIKKKYEEDPDTFKVVAAGIGIYATVGTLTAGTIVFALRDRTARNFIADQGLTTAFLDYITAE